MAERRARILDAAAVLLTQGGIHALTMRALSESAGVSVPTIYNLIGGRDDVFVALMGRIGVVVEAELAAITSDPVDRCFDIAAHFVERVTTRAAVTRSLFAEGLGFLLASTDEAPLRRYGAAFGQAIADGVSRGDLEPPTTVLLLTEQLVSLLALRTFRWASESAVPGSSISAEVELAVALTLLAAATDATRPTVLRRVADATITLTP